MNMSLKNAKLMPMINDQGTPTVLVFPDMASGNWSDEDWGSAGPACIFSIGVCIATGKDGIAYPIKTANLGGTTARRPHRTLRANCAKLAAPPVWLTMSPGPGGSLPNRSHDIELFSLWRHGTSSHDARAVLRPSVEFLDDFRLG